MNPTRPVIRTVMVPAAAMLALLIGQADAQQSVRFATFNTSLAPGQPGALLSRLAGTTDSQARTVAETIQRVDPDVILLNEFDWDPNGLAVERFQQNYLSVSQNGADPVHYPHVYLAPVNTGVLSGYDLDNSSYVGLPGDGWGYGSYEGHYGMVLLSKHPIVGSRTFQHFLWKDMPGALRPQWNWNPDEQWFYDDQEWAEFRLSSKSHWDVAIDVGAGQVVHALASHPTPPTFDYTEDRNGRRNHDEIRFWADYVTAGAGGYIYDDDGAFGQLAPGERFVILGDLNADCHDGDSTGEPIELLLGSPRVNTSLTPTSDGGPDAALRTGGANADHTGDPAYDTADFNDSGPGNLRTDYVLPSDNLTMEDARVFWPRDEDPNFYLVGDYPFPASDHRLVWVDVTVTLPGDANRDGRVSDADYTIWADNFGSVGVGWTEGDFNGDGAVTDADYTIWADNFGAGDPTPEPASLAGLIAAGALLTGRRLSTGRN